MGKIKKTLLGFLAWSVMLSIIINICSGALGAGLILSKGLASSSLGYVGNRLLMAAAMPSFSGDLGYIPKLAEAEFTENFYFDKAKSIAGNQSDDYARILASLFPDESFPKAEGYPVSEVDLHPSYEGENTKLWNNIYIRNQSGQTPDTDSLMRGKLTFKEKSSGPLVLIYHTHTSESFNTTGETYTSSSPTHSENNDVNIAAVGKTFADALQALGIESVQCTDRLDKSYNDAYDRSLSVIGEYLEKYPSIQVVIDMHRDALIDDDNTQYRPVVNVQGLKTAQILIIVGSGGGDYPDNPYFEDNFRFGVSLGNALEESCPGITRSVTLKYSDFNQRLSPNSILVEMGASGNTLTEAKRAAVFLAAATARILYENNAV